MTTREPFHSGTCDCNREPGQCVKGDLDRCPAWDDDEYGDNDGPEPGDDCGRWDNGRLTRYCTKAGTEECDWDCPYSN